MASASIPNNKRSARIAIVEEHIRLENRHDLEGVLRTFGDTAIYRDEAWGQYYKDRNGVRLFYEQLMKALPDLEIGANSRVPAMPACIHLTPMIVWPGKKFTTTAAPS